MRRVGIVLWLALLTAGCGVAASPPLEFRDRFAPADGPLVDVRAVLQREHARDAPRYLRAAVASLATLTPWLGPYRHRSLTIVDPPWRGQAPGEPDAVTIGRVPWWSTPTSMTVEIATARAIARQQWSDLVDTRALPESLVEGLAEYTARRIVTPLFQVEHLEPGYAMHEERYFGRFVPRFVRLRLPPESDGRTVLTLNTLERWVSRPVLDGALAAFVRNSRSRRPTLDDFERAVSAASGEDLSWIFAQTLSGDAVFDYAIEDLTSEPNPSGGFDTTVVAARLGDGVFSGTTAPRVGPFESGRGMTLRVSFDDGQQIDDQWDGRDTRKTFTYCGPARAVSATLDPARVVVLDVHRTNNGRTLRPRASTAASRWAARWSLWLQSVVLTYGFFV